ncbi:hypothetical protein DSO57_1035790 [Entomophthora muscae]|uniref:Uncharacterized protein n=1 Tax=Entomophthora muscae TaxID=34485 RepID=A0ACC2RE34_9FUNG|nr:hypothetical protein DSO57_1035790 [Entomophthora muscae]
MNTKSKNIIIHICSSQLPGTQQCVKYQGVDHQGVNFTTVALQEGHDSKLQPAAYYSRKFILPELNYPIYNKEMLAIVATKLPDLPDNVSYNTQGALNELPLDISNNMD